MLSDVRNGAISSSCPGPGPSCPAAGVQPGAQGLRVSAQDTAAALPFAGQPMVKLSTYPRDTHRHTEDAGTASHCLHVLC